MCEMFYPMLKIKYKLDLGYFDCLKNSKIVQYQTEKFTSHIRQKHVLNKYLVR